MTATLFESGVTRLDAENAAIQEMFGGMRRVSTGARRNTDQFTERLVQFETFMDGIRTGRRRLAHFAEAMSSSDFPLLFDVSLDRQLYAAYAAITPTWQNYARASTVNNFLKVQRYATSGIRGLLQKVGELAEFERRSQTETMYEYSVHKYEAGFAVSWETMMNDDLGAFLRLPQDLAQSAVDSEEAFVTQLFCDASGPHASHYTVGNANIITGNPGLDRDSLQAAITQLMQRKDERGNPIVVKGVRLVVGTGLALTAQEIINTTEYRVVDANGNVRVIQGNGVASNLGIDVNYWIDSIATTANASTSWWIFADPNGVRPALEFGRLRGHEAPALYEKIPDMRRIGGGEEPYSFDTESAEKKVRHVYGGTFVDARMTLASNGTGS
ncbi:hypothetical protein DQ384_05405 [Sphaerisporangium album]|uniref:Bacteriophage Mu GpT domain-containing protein n=1 Tax=Sphaerisporangium album TaxID=509200 RepID=A0A367FPZ7_9ACTN|nr:hypothetical protein [Sphaerisporangium album]RCG31979.1 hypothetical protein DQ384_05405 [Sphaerisporangium album]